MWNAARMGSRISFQSSPTLFTRSPPSSSRWKTTHHSKLVLFAKLLRYLVYSASTATTARLSFWGAAAAAAFPAPLVLVHSNNRWRRCPVLRITMVFAHRQRRCQVWLITRWHVIIAGGWFGVQSSRVVPSLGECWVLAKVSWRLVVCASLCEVHYSEPFQAVQSNAATILGMDLIRLYW